MAGGTNYDLVIVGLGPVGAVAANLAGRAGLRTLVVERSDTPYAKPRAIVFDAEIMRVFASIGLADAITAITRPLGGSIYLGADRRPIRTFRARQPEHDLAWHSSNLFYQPELEAVLRDGIGRFPHVEQRHRVSVTDIDEGRLTLVDANGVRSAVEARFVLACDGASSTVRKALGVGLDDIGFEERWLVVDTFVHGPMRWPDAYAIPEEVRDGRYSLMLCDPARPATLIPGTGRHRRWEYMLLPGELPDDRVPEDWLLDQLATWIDPDNVEVVRSAVYRFRALVARRWRIGDVFLVGDAAHQTPPFYGQGMCHGIRDAAQLIWKLKLVRDAAAGDRLLDSYQVEREPHVRAIIAASVEAGAAVCTLDRAAATARDAEFRRLEAERDGRSAAMTDVVPPIEAGVIDPETGGMRLPELAVEGEAGAVPLDTLLGEDMTLVSLGIAAAEGLRTITVSETGPGLRDRAGMLAAWLARHGARHAIVRPDRYIHALADDAALPAKLDLLSRQLGHVHSTPMLEVAAS